MTAYRGLYVKGTAGTPSVGTTPLEARLVAAGHIAENSPGVPRVGVMWQGTANLVTATATTAPLSYNIGACNLVLNRVAGEGVYEVSLVGTTVANTIAAPSSNSRWDLIYVGQNDIEKGDPDNTAVVGVVNGVAAASPTKPYASVPAGALVLAEAQIFAGTTTTAGGTNTLAQVWPYTALRDVPIPIRNSTERAALTPAPGQRIRRLDLKDVIETWNAVNNRWDWPAAAQGVLSLLQGTANSGSIGSGFVVVNNVQSFTFKAGRRYRIVWDLAYQIAINNSPANVLIATAATTDAAGSTTGTTQLQGRTITAPVTGQNATGHIEAWFPVATVDTTLQIKWIANCPSSSMIITGSATNPNNYTIEDCGAQI